MKSKLEDIQSIYDMFSKSKREQNGFILLPDIKWFKVFEINEERLKLYLALENYHKQAGEEQVKQQPI